MFVYEKSEKKVSKKVVQKKASEKESTPPNLTGITDNIKAKSENLSGFSFDDVSIHYSSDKPAQLQALAYTQGNQVYIGAGQEKHLGHVLQQKQGIIKPTAQINNTLINDDARFESEADQIGRWIESKTYTNVSMIKNKVDPGKISENIVQRVYVNNAGTPVNPMGSLQGASDSGDLLRNAGDLGEALYQTYHHIIPKQLLNRFWNKLIQKGQAQRLKGMMYGIVENYSKKMASTKDEPTNPLRHIDEGGNVSGDLTFKDIRANVTKIGAVSKSPAAMEALATLYQWLPGNLVLGPTARVHDTHDGDALDKEAAFIKGDCDTEPTKEFYGTLYNDMIAVVDAIAPDKARVSSIIERIIGLSKGQVCKSNPDKWMQVGAGEDAGRPWKYNGYTR